MKNRFIHSTCMTLLLAMSPLLAGASSIGYEFAIDGAYITEAKVSAHEWSHRAVYTYAPWEYLELGIALGAAKYDVNSYAGSSFDGDYQFSPAAHLFVSSPAIIHEILRLRIGASGQYFSSDDNEGNYSAQVWDPQAMLVFQSHCMQLELGGKVHWIKGEMDAKGQESTLDFSNKYLPRGLVNLQFTGRKGYFVKGSFEASQHLSGWHSGPTDTRVALTIGYQTKSETRKPKYSAQDRYFPSVPAMRTQQDQMRNEMRTSETQDSTSSNR